MNRDCEDQQKKFNRTHVKSLYIYSKSLPDILAGKEVLYAIGKWFCVKIAPNLHNYFSFFLSVSRVCSSQEIKFGTKNK